MTPEIEKIKAQISTLKHTIQELEKQLELKERKAITNMSKLNITPQEAEHLVRKHYSWDHPSLSYPQTTNCTKTYTNEQIDEARYYCRLSIIYSKNLHPRVAEHWIWLIKSNNEEVHLQLAKDHADHLNAIIARDQNHISVQKEKLREVQTWIKENTNASK